MTKPDVFNSFLARIQRGELDPLDNHDQRVRQFAREVIAATESGFFTAREAAVLWLHHLRRLGFTVDIPGDEPGA